MHKFKRFERNGGDQVISLEVDGGADERRGVDYHATKLTEDAINTALALGRPLLVSGEPGCGKTELGFAIARKLGIDRVRFFSVKSDVEAQRLFYEHDTIRRFHAAQIAGKAGADSDGTTASTDPRNFIRYQALGQAILDASVGDTVKELLASGNAPPENPVRSVVIIDEIDKAPRDFPNDLLNEIDQLWFRVPELAGWVDNPETPRGNIPPELRPIIVITSNIERQLPDAFLRRCVFHHIEPLDDTALHRVVESHLERDAIKLSDGELGNAITLVSAARKAGMDKSTGLAELLEFARAIGFRSGEFADKSFSEKATACLSAIGKTTRDKATISKTITELFPGR